MSKLVDDALRRVQSLSSATGRIVAIAQELRAPEDKDATIKALRARVAQLEERIVALTSSNLPAEPDEQDLAYLRESVNKRLEASDTSRAAALYNRDYFSDQPNKHVRYVTAQCLINYFKRASVEPLDLWRNIVAADGEIQ